jgi:hypothetical protein
MRISQELGLILVRIDYEGNSAFSLLENDFVYNVYRL